MRSLLPICAVVALAGCIKATPESHHGVPQTSTAMDVRVWTDPGTGCEYLIDMPNSHRGGITPRMRPDGTQSCETTESP